MANSNDRVKRKTVFAVGIGVMGVLFTMSLPEPHTRLLGRFKTDDIRT